MFQIGGGSSKPIKVFVRVNGVRLPMELDTGAAVSIISRDMKEKYFPSTPLQMSRVVLRTYTNERMGVVDELNVEVGDKGQEKKLKLYVVEQEGPTLFGWNWLEQIQLDWKVIQWASAESHEDVKPLIDKYNNVFSNELGAITGFEAHLEVKPQATPVFCKARPIPFSLKPQVDQELDRLVDVGILKKVSYSEWATPIVPVPKKDGQLRICGDYKVSINPCLVVDKYPLSRRSVFYLD